MLFAFDNIVNEKPIVNLKDIPREHWWPNLLKFTNLPFILSSKVQNYPNETIYYIVDPWNNFANFSQPTAEKPIYSIPQKLIDQQVTILFILNETIFDPNEMYHRVKAAANDRKIKNFFILTTNIYMSEKYQDVFYYSYFEDAYRYKLSNVDIVTEINTKQRKKKFTLLNNIDKWERRIFSAILESHNVLEHGYFSYLRNNYNQPDYQKEKRNQLVRDLAHEQHYESILKLDNKMPIVLENDITDVAFNHDYLPKHLYTEAYWNLVVETSNKTKSMTFTEKTWKPIANLQPFILLSGHNSIEHLRKLGYRTFKHCIDESYANEAEINKRTELTAEAAINVIKQDDEWQMEKIRILSNILEHNQKHFFNHKSRFAQTMINIEQRNN